MKNKYLYTLLILCHFFFLQSQESFIPELEVNYDIHFNTEIPITKKGKLYIGESNSLFIYGKEKSSEVNSKEENEINIVLASITKFNYTDYTKDTIYSLDKVNKKFIIKEKKPMLKWVLENEEKLIDSLLLKKASLSFRGRNYIAWYTENYPINAGPWKFNSLPGLIIEVYDVSGRYRWVTTSIFQKSFSEIPIDFVEIINNTDEITINEYVNRRYNNASNLIDSSRLPRNSKIQRNKINRNGIEIKFEWEEERMKD